MAQPSPPAVTTTNSFAEGYSIKYPLQQAYQQGQDFDFHFHVYNLSNGVPINSSIICYLHIYDSHGSHLLQLQQTNVSDLFDYEFEILGGNFSDIGIYEAVIQCNRLDLGLGGYEAFEIMVTPSGNAFNIPQAILYTFFMVILIGMFLLCTWAGLSLPWGNERSREGEVIKVNWKKYLKMFSASWAYVTLIWIVYMGWTLSWAYLQWQGLGTIFKLTFYILMGTALPIFFGIIILFIVSFLSDAKIQAGINKFTKGIQ